MGQGVWVPMHPDHRDEYDCVFFAPVGDWCENLQYYLRCYIDDRLRSKSRGAIRTRWVYNKHGSVPVGRITNVRDDRCASILWYNSHFAIVMHDSDGPIGLCYACRDDAPAFAKAVLDDRATALWKYLEQCGYGFYRRDGAYSLRPVKFNPDPQ